MQRGAVVLLFLAACGKPDEPVNALPYMPPVPEADSRPFDARTFLTPEHLKAAGFSADTAIEPLDATATSGSWILSRPKQPPTQFSVELLASPAEAKTRFDAMVRSRTPRGEAPKTASTPDFLAIEQEPFLPEGTWIRQLDIVRIRGPLLLHLRLEETSKDADGAAAAAAMERRAKALLDPVSR